MRASDIRFGSPQFRLLSESQIEALHLASLQILERTGVNVQSQEALELLGYAGADVDNVERVRIPSYLVERALRAAPKTITLYSREGEPAIVLNGSSGSHFGGMTALAEYLDPHTGQRRPCYVDDVIDMTRVVDALPNLEWIMTIASYPTIPGQIADRVTALQTILNTSKPVMASIFDGDGLREILEICAIIAGGEKAFIARPFLVSFSMAISPLILGQDALEKDFICAEKKIPNVVYSSAMAGATSPATLPATIAISVAEFLSQLVIIQLKNPGAPVIVGASPSIMDMKALIYAFGAPEAYFIDAALTEIAHSYRLPIFNTSGQTDAVAIDAQAAAEATYQMVMAMLCGADFVHGVGEMYQGRMASPEYAVLCSEIIDMVGGMMRGIEINEDTLPLDLIDRVGPKGSYVSEKHTLKHFRRFWAPSIFDRSAVRMPESKSCAELVREKTINILKSHRPKPLPSDITKELRKVEKHWLRKVGLKDYPKRS